jgi:hypothetical protein
MRRAFRRPLRRAFAPDIPPLLQRANQMMAAGNYAEAASAFEQLARAAEARRGPRAPLFYLQSGRARVLAGQSAAGMDYLQRGLGLFAARGQAGKVFNAGNRIVAELNQRGMGKEAGQITAYVKSLLPGFNLAASETAPAKRATLPTHCPSCGAPVHSDEVDWMDDVTAECAFCGSPVRGEI